METYDNKKTQDQSMRSLPTKRSENLVPFVDRRESAVMQKKLLDAIHSVQFPTGFHSSKGTIQRMGKFLKPSWDKLSEEQKQKFYTANKLTGAEPYFSDTSTTHDSKLRAFLKKEKDEQEAQAAKDLEAMAVPVPVGPAYTSLAKTDAKATSLGEIPLTIPQMDFEGVIVADGVNIRITMPPIPELPEGTVIGFIQVVQSPLVEAAAKTRADKYKEGQEGEGVGWTIDRQGIPDPKNPYYGVNDDETGSSNCTLGSKTNPAVMLDAPSYQGSQAWSPRFETTAVIKACPILALVGTALATVRWGFDRIPSGIVTWNPAPQQLASPSAQFTKAVQVWNTLYAGKEDWKKIPAIH